MEWEVFYSRPHPGKYSRNSASSRKEDEALKEKRNGWASWSNASLSSSPHVCLLRSSVHVCQRWLHAALRWFQSRHLRNISCLQYILIWMTMVWKYKPRWKLKIWLFSFIRKKKEAQRENFWFFDYLLSFYAPQSGILRLKCKAKTEKCHIFLSNVFLFSFFFPWHCESWGGSLTAADPTAPRRHRFSSCLSNRILNLSNKTENICWLPLNRDWMEQWRRGETLDAPDCPVQPFCPGPLAGWPSETKGS